MSFSRLIKTRIQRYLTLNINLIMNHGFMHSHHYQMCLMIKLLMKQVTTDSEITKINSFSLMLNHSRVIILMTLFNISLAVTT